MTETNDTQNATEGNKGINALAYLLFFLPLIVEKDSESGKFHANQGLLLLLFTIAVGILGSIPFIGWFVILPIGGIMSFVFFIIGIMNAINGRMKELPLFGSIKIIK